MAVNLALHLGVDRQMQIERIKNVAGECSSQTFKNTKAVRQDCRYADNCFWLGRGWRSDLIEIVI